jgi:hypothetical protein
MSERFVDTDKAAAHLAITRRALLDLVRQGHLPGHPLAQGRRRHVWRFRLSELDQAMASRAPVVPIANEPNWSPSLRSRKSNLRSQRS